ncbi:MAG: hypothetical protein HY670_03625 [Chloroflexi bacterium]|nr:hypothetical protein [Chloroflexota bacterium]
MAIRVNIDPDLQRYYRCPGTIEVDGTTVAECLDRLVTVALNDKDASAGKGALEGTLLFLNRQAIYETDRPVKDGDELDVVVMPYGG